jgi:hypothetical protein
MYVTRLFYGSNLQSALEKLDPNWTDMDSAIRALNGDDRNQVGLMGPNDDYLQVAGGPVEFIVGCRTLDRLRVLTDSTRDKNQTSWIYEGQGAYYPQDECVSIDLVLIAARTFAESGRLEPSCTWK